MLNQKINEDKAIESICRLSPDRKEELTQEFRLISY